MPQKVMRMDREGFYLDTCRVSQDPPRPATKPWFDVLRLWLLVQRLQRAADELENIVDRLIRGAATRLLSSIAISSRVRSPV